jgi:hypothetical protein
MTVSIERNCASRIGRVGILTDVRHDLIFLTKHQNQNEYRKTTNRACRNAGEVNI